MPLKGLEQEDGNAIAIPGGGQENPGLDGRKGHEIHLSGEKKPKTATGQSLHFPVKNSGRARQRVSDTPLAIYSHKIAKGKFTNREGWREPFVPNE